MLKSLILNTGSNAGMYFVRTVITFVMTPIFVKNLGAHDYGIWEIVTVAVGYMGLFDLGIKPAVSRFVAYYKSLMKNDALMAVYSTTMLYMFLLGVIAFASGVMVSLIKPEILIGNANISERYQWLIFIIGAQLLIMFPGKIAECTLEGYQKYYLSNNVTVIFMIISSVLIYKLITPSNALLMIAAISAISSSVKYVVFYVILKRQSPYPVYFSKHHVSSVAFKEVLSFSLKSFAQAATYTVGLSVDKLVITAFDGVNVIIYYVLPTNLIRVFDALILTLTQATMPLFSELHGSDKKEVAKKYYLFGSKIIFSFSSLIGVGTFMMGEKFIGYWIGIEYGNKAPPIITGLVITTILLSVNPLGHRYLTAMNSHGILAKTNLLYTILLIPTSIILVKIHGYVGVAYAGIFPALIVTPIILNKTCRMIGVGVSTYLQRTILPSILPAICVFMLMTMVLEYELVGSMVELILHALIAAVAFFGVYYVIGMRGDEKHLLISKIKSAFDM